MTSNKMLSSDDYRFVSFVDILGYRHIVKDSVSDKHAYLRLHSIFENFINAFEGSFLTDAYGHQLYTNIERIGFSDCLYFSSRTLPHLIDMLQSFFIGVYIFQTSTYNFAKGNWMPYIRAGIDYGWVKNFRDPTIPEIKNPLKIYRNPVGSGITKAYLTTEEDIALPGMRIFMRKDLLKKTQSIAYFPWRLMNERECYLDICEENPDVVEVVWPLEVIANSNCDFWLMLSKTREQFENNSSFKHFNKTRDLFEKAVKISEDSHAVEIWNRNNSSFPPLED